MRKNWTATILIFLGGIAVAMTLNEVAPVMDFLMEDLNMSLVTVSSLVSILTLAGLLMTLIAGPFIMKVGAKRAVVMALCAIGLGGLIGAIAPNTVVCLVSRFIEGLGYGLVAIACPTLINQLFPPEKRGLPAGIWATWISVGILLVFNGASFVVPVLGWRGLFGVLAGFAFLMAIVLGLLKLDGAYVDDVESVEAESGKHYSVKDVLKMPESWCMFVVFLAVTFTITSYATYLPSYLMDNGLSFAAANGLASAQTIGCVVGSVVLGIIMGRMRNTWPLLPIVAGVLAIMSFFMFRCANVVFIVGIGFFMGCLPTLCFANSGRLVPNSALIAIIMSVLAVGDSLGGIVAPLIDAVIIESYGFGLELSLTLMTVPLLATIAATFVAVRQTRKMKLAEGEE